MEMVVTFLIQAGQYEDSYKLLQELLEIEEKQLGARAAKLAEIYHLMAKTKSEIVKNHNFVTMDQLEEDQETVALAKKSLSYRDKLEGEEHELKKALIGILITHHMLSL
ncbi:hypothetical protein AC249_AIPGENE19769 [Exaiptasia diaphana]|nr:hypothetical protein AC249_AIPGENE19769 [Exaiptasia diaphana]